jgi:hypothetical protein
MPWTFWLFMAFAACIIVGLGVLAVLDAIHGDEENDDDTWRDDYTGWG